ncbi:hypothetical protein AXG93_4201s1380 [Marchantia polymorpha subsp. ruderalis]|uniref:Uncharacterized protein n=1 Tax=Marchantia polymorpha subsp. ruderalis TaxID=1480154 RepID=A0A176WB18_MARPO|nr:hypothetical protein AXG93_4201s1380 [Marchantia polymorpha subsp. ruderalis]
MNLRCGGRASEKEVQLSTKGTERGEASKEERRDERNCRKAMRRIQQRFFPRRNKLEASVRVGPQSDVAEAKRTRPCAEHTLKAFFRPSASIDGANLHVIRSSGLHVIRQRTSIRHTLRSRIEAAVAAVEGIPSFAPEIANGVLPPWLLRSLRPDPDQPRFYVGRQSAADVVPRGFGCGVRGAGGVGRAFSRWGAGETIRRRALSIWAPIPVGLGSPRLGCFLSLSPRARARAVVMRITAEAFFFARGREGGRMDGGRARGMYVALKPQSISSTFGQ